ncbi:hypothetical protein [Actinophytocola algeriensis]|uniref:Uncharacterized protein n=1 Tax=Actinophytocola algeriensis TaxID=1768010 RepID=A0A7W7QEJ3_9PSEU|nr:hypothetical protein [Actinophytocola algeriensis]MBB4912008.1 hypothetical protein [Actinophytocola algeriensis]MBE1477500.1 hypothetical protein [Actinophytocola algeriensis]
MVDLGFDNPDDPATDSTGGAEMSVDQALSRTYLRLMEGFRPGPDWWQYALETVPGTLEVVVFDYPVLVSILTDEQVARYGHERLCAAGLANLAREEPDVEVIGAVHCLTGSVHTASTALVLPAMIARASGETEFPNGVLVSMPERSVLLYHVLRDESMHDAIESMVAMTGGAFDDGHKPISRHLYWWNRGEFSAITRYGEDDTVEIHVDGEFADAFHRVTDIPVGRG